MLIRLVALTTALSLASASNAQAQVFDPFFYGDGFGKSVRVGVGFDRFGGKSVVVGVNKGFHPGFHRGFHPGFHRGFHPGFHRGFRGGFYDPFCYY